MYFLPFAFLDTPRSVLKVALLVFVFVLFLLLIITAINNLTFCVVLR